MAEDLTPSLLSHQDTVPSCLYTHCAWERENSQISTSDCLIFLETDSHLGQGAWLYIHRQYIYIFIVL